MIIAIDLDDVLAASLQDFIEFYNATFDEKLTLGSFTGFTLHESIGMSSLDELKLMKEYESSSRDIKPLQGAQGAVKQLQKEHTLIVVTSRSKGAEKETRAWLQNYFPSLQEIHFTRDEQRICSKASICKKIDADIMIEDHPTYAKECVDAGIPVVLFDYPYNRKLSGKNIHRVKSWDDVLKFFQ